MTDRIQTVLLFLILLVLLWNAFHAPTPTNRFVVGPEAVKGPPLSSAAFAFDSATGEVCATNLAPGPMEAFPPCSQLAKRSR